MALRAPDFRGHVPSESCASMMPHRSPGLRPRIAGWCRPSEKNIRLKWKSLVIFPQRGSKTLSSNHHRPKQRGEQHHGRIIQRLIMSIKWPNHAPVLVVQSTQGWSRLHIDRVIFCATWNVSLFSFDPSPGTTIIDCMQPAARPPMSSKNNPSMQSNISTYCGWAGVFLHLTSPITWVPPNWLGTSRRGMFNQLSPCAGTIRPA